jgi:hypothetical protein
MGIIDRLKKGKKSESVLDSLVKKKEPEKTKDSEQSRPSDIEVRELNPASEAKLAMPDDIGMQPVEEDIKQTREFRTQGMHEFTLDSLGNSPNAGIKVEYQAKVKRLMDEDKFDEAINALRELKQRLAKAQ